MLQATKCGDEVEHGKPAPDCFHATAAKIGVAAEDCLVVEDAPAGVQAATAAGMRVVVVPSIRDKEAYPKPDPKAAAGSCLMPAMIHCNSGVPASTVWCKICRETINSHFSRLHPHLQVMDRPAGSISAAEYISSIYQPVHTSGDDSLQMQC